MATQHVVTIRSPPNGAVVRSRTLTVSGTAQGLDDRGGEPIDVPVDVAVDVTGEPQRRIVRVLGTWTTRFELRTPGTKRVTARAGDATATATVETVFDRTPPVLAIDAPKANDRLPLPGPAIRATGRATDDTAIDRVEWRLRPTERFRPVTGRTGTDRAWNWFVNLPRLGVGQHTISMRAFDRAGLQTAVQARTFEVVDVGPPRLAITSPPESPVTVEWQPPGVSIAIAGTTSDTETSVKTVDWRSGDGPWRRAKLTFTGARSATWAATVDLPAIGTHRIDVRAFDEERNMTVGGPLIVEAVEPPPPPPPPGDELAWSEPGPVLTVGAAEAGDRIRRAMTPNDGLDAPLLWSVDGNELVVHPQEATVDIATGLIIVTLPVFCDQTGRVDVQVPLAVGSEDEPAGMVAAPAKPRGPTVVVGAWSEQLTSLAWSAVVETAADLARRAGRDPEGVGLIPTAVESGDGLTVRTAARHRTDRRRV